MDNESANRIEQKLNTVINLLVGTVGTIMALTAMQVGEQHGNHWEGCSVFMATMAFFATTICLRWMLRK